MLKKISLRARLTLLSAMVMASVAVMLTGMFLVGADRIFVRNLQQHFVTQSDEYLSLIHILCSNIIHET